MKANFFFSALFLGSVLIVSGCSQQDTQQQAQDIISTAAQQQEKIIEKATEQQKELIEKGLEQQQEILEQGGLGVEKGKEYIVTITDSGYVPQKATIKQGDSVRWVNVSSAGNWPASARHPTHEVYPGSSITKCNTAEESRIFDACKAIKSGESYSFTFNEKGTWGYHNHLTGVTTTGQVVVE